MATKKSASPQHIYQIKVTLRGTKPPIWRRLLVPSSLTLAQLHDVLQTAMGWAGGHMHEFRAGHRHFGTPDPEDLGMGSSYVENERTIRLSKVLWRSGAKVIYTYDFGDNWEHAVVLEKILPLLPDLRYPTCIDGKLACPPEDCGGIPGYYDLIGAIADPGHERHEEISEWMSDDFDSQAFSVDDVNRMLSPTLSPGKAAKN